MIVLVFLVDVENHGNTPMKGPFAKLSIANLVSLILASVVAIFLLGACLIVAIHRVQEGHVGVYYRNGRLIDDISDPGIRDELFSPCKLINDNFYITC